MASPEPQTPPEETPAQGVSRFDAAAPLWRRAIPHLATAAVAVLVSILVQGALGRAAGAPPAPPTLTTPTPRPTIAATPAPTVNPTAAPPLAAGITSQELADLRTEDDKIWTAIYLSRAISQIAEAEAAMRSNNLGGVDQSLIETDDSLALAYRRAAGAQSDPIDQLRRDASAIREDLYLRPEGMDARLSRLRQTILALIEERV